MSRFLTPHAAALPSTVPFTGPRRWSGGRASRSGRGWGRMKACFGPSPQAIAAMQAAAADTWMYGDPENHDLKQALAAITG
jgi:histidinol-phosphate aminotransferase